MTGSTKQNRSEPSRSKGKCRVAKPGDAGAKTAASQLGVYATDDDSTLDGSGKQQVRSKTYAWTASEQWQEDQQSTEYIKAARLSGSDSLSSLPTWYTVPQGDLPPPLSPHRQDSLVIRVKASAEAVTHA